MEATSSPLPLTSTVSARVKLPFGLLGCLGSTRMSSDPFAPLNSMSSVPHPPSREVWTVACPAPDDAPPPPTDHPKLGRPSQLWIYGDADGRLLGFSCRFDGPEGKSYRPLTFWRGPRGQSAWRWEAWPTPRPLYRLEDLAGRPNALVVITEGEKAADAAARLLPDCVATTSPNGARSASKADWS